MAKKSGENTLGIKIELDPKSRRIAEMIDREWTKRASKLQQELLYRMSRYVLDAIFAKFPKGSEYEDYRKALKHVEVTGVPKGTFSYAIYGKRRRRKSITDTATTILYVRPRRKMRRPSDAVLVLEKYSPWTTSTIPFTPTKKNAVVVSRKVSQREVLAVEKLRAKDRLLWRGELEKLGVRSKAKKGITELSAKKMKIIQDLAFTAIRAELGGGDERAQPHWRPAFNSLKSIGMKKFMADKKLWDALSDPEYKGWKTWPTKAEGRITLKVAKSFRAFQKRLGIK